MSFVAVAIGGAGLLGAAGSVVSGVLGSNAAKSASQAQIGFEQQALNVQQQQYKQAQGNLQPFINVGTGAANTLGTLTGAGGAKPDYSAFINSPDYAFALSQGNAALQNYLNANGLAGSGAGITSAINYNQGLASQQYGNYFNRLMQIATLGGNAANTGANLASNTANTVGNTLGNIGQSTASGIIGSTNAVTGAIGAGTSALNTGVNNALLYNAINRGQVNPSSYAYGTTALSGASGGGYNPNYTTGAPT